MIIISAKQFNLKLQQNESVCKEQIQLDHNKLTEIYQKMKKSDPTWPFFVGTIDIENRTYQVY